MKISRRSFLALTGVTATAIGIPSLACLKTKEFLDLPTEGFLFTFSETPFLTKLKNRTVFIPGQESHVGKAIYARCSMALIYEASAIFNCSTGAFVKSRHPKYEAQLFDAVRGYSSEDIVKLFELPSDERYPYRTAPRWNILPNRRRNQ